MFRLPHSKRLPSQRLFIILTLTIGLGMMTVFAATVRPPKKAIVNTPRCDVTVSNGQGTGVEKSACYTYEARLHKLPVVYPKPPKPAIRLPFFAKYVPVAKGQSPNSIRLVRSQVLPPISAKKVNGKWVCAKKGDKPGKSDKYGYGHVDRQCCLDPDEIPNPYCTY